MVMAAHTHDAEAAQFQRHGYLIVRQLIGASECATLRATVATMLDPLQGPAEFEVDTGYPGAPADRLAAGGSTPRRLLHAYSRDPLLRARACDPRVARHLKALFGGRAAYVSQCHHNCIMTKHPGYSSLTAWHQDIRYWSFERPDLISTWLALGAERKANGALQVIPGSHTLSIASHRYDPALFLRTDLAENQALIANARTVELDAGDVLFFHCRLFHAAPRNETDAVKYSVVFTYHDAENHPTPGTRSAAYPSIPLPQ
jgi:phytanoyl-CoA hydroxylase